MAILSSFGPQHPLRGVTELAGELSLSRSAVSRLLASLEAAGYVVQDQRTGLFRLGVRALELGYAFVQTNEVILRAAPHLTELARRLQMHAHLYALDNGQLFRYFWVPYPTGVGMLTGFRAAAHATAAGKVLLAHLADDELDRVVRRWGLAAVTSRTITEPEHLRAHLKVVREQGYAFDDGESNIGTRCVAVPVRDASGGVVAAASVSGPRTRLTDEEVPHIRDQLHETAAYVSMALGYGMAPPPAGMQMANKRDSPR